MEIIRACLSLISETPSIDLFHFFCHTTTDVEVFHNGDLRG